LWFLKDLDDFGAVAGGGGDVERFAGGQAFHDLMDVDPGPANLGIQLMLLGGGDHVADAVG